MLSERELNRYKRQIMLFGKGGQERLKGADIFIAGAGGLGSPIAIYLAVAGVGRITIVDMDIVDESNLNRQILHCQRDVGRKKAESAEEKLRLINPDIEIRAISTAIEKGNVLRLTNDADCIVDALDNFAARYLLNDAAIAKQIPLFHGAIRGMDGQATTIIPGSTPCLRCIFKSPPPEEVVPAVGVTAGIIGMVQAAEVIKYLTGNGSLLANRLFIWEGLKARAEEIRVEKDPLCPACGTMEHAPVTRGR